MAGTYPDIPQFRIPYDKDGTIVMSILGGDPKAALFKTFTDSEKAELNDEDTGAVTFGSGSNATWLIFYFQEPYDLTGFVFEHPMAPWGGTHDMHYSHDTTVGNDGNWATATPRIQPTGVGTQAAARSVQTFHGAPLRNVRGFRFYVSHNSYGPSTAFYCHFFGVPSANALAQLVSDNFNRADAQTVGDPQIGSRPLSVTYVGGSTNGVIASSTFGISANQLGPVGPGATANDDHAIWAVAASEYNVEATLAVLSTAGTRVHQLVVRFNGTNVGYLVGSNNGETYRIVRRDGYGTSVILASHATQVPVAGDRLRVEVRAASITLLVNGVQVVQVAEAQWPGHSWVGIRSFDKAVRWDDLVITPVAAIPAAPNANERLAVWDPTLNQAVGPAYLDLGDLRAGQTGTRQFRIRNMSATATGGAVTVSREVLTDTNPTSIAEYTLSLDGTNWSSSVSLGDLPPGGTSAVVSFRRVVGANPQYGPSQVRLTAIPTTWS